MTSVKIGFNCCVAECLPRATPEQVPGVHLLHSGRLSGVQRGHPPPTLPDLLQGRDLVPAAAQGQTIPPLHSAPVDIHGALPVSTELRNIIEKIIKKTITGIVAGIGFLPFVADHGCVFSPNMMTHMALD